MPDNIVGSAWIEVLPRTTGFESALLGGMKGPMAKAEGMFSGFGKTAALAVGGIGLAGAGAGLALAKMAGNFQQQMTLIRTQAGDTEDNIGALSKQVLALAGQVGQAPDQLAQGLYHLASAGFRGAEAMDMLTMGAKLADVGQSDFQTTMQAVIFTMRSGLKDIHNASDAVAMLNAVVGTGDMRMQDLTQALASGILPVAAQFGVSMQSVGAALAFMTDRGVPANEATTRLRMSLALLAAPTRVASKLLTDAGVGSQEASYRVNAMTKALHDSGVSTSQLADDLKKPDGIMVALQDLKKHMDAAGVSASMQEATLSRAFGGGKSGGTIMMLYGQLDLLSQKYEQVGKNSKDFTNAWTIQSQTYTQRTADAKAAAEALGITWGNVLLPAATGVMTFLGDVAQNLGGVATGTASADKPAKAFASTLKDIGGFAATAATDLKPVGQWMMDHKSIIENIGLALGAWWAVDKIAGWTSAATGAFQTVIGKLTFSGTGGAGGAAQAGMGMRVFVTNMPPGGFGAGGGAGGAATGAGELAIGGAAGRLAAGGFGASVLGAGALGAAFPVSPDTTAAIIRGAETRKALNALQATLTDAGASAHVTLAELRALASVEQTTGPLTRRQVQVFAGAWETGVHDTGQITSYIKNMTGPAGQALSSTRAASSSLGTLAGVFGNVLKPAGELGQDLYDLSAAVKAATLNARRISDALAQAGSPTGAPGTGHGALSGVSASDLVLALRAGHKP